MTFQTDLQVGKDVEKTVLIQIQNKYPKAFMIDGKFSPYDIFIPEISKGIEVKSDRKSKHTGNLVIEVSMFGKPSALMATLADYWVIYTGNQFIWITPLQLKNMIVENGLQLRTFIGNGDTQPKKAYLPKIEMVVRYSTSIQNYEKDEQ
tara:strand:+ start:3780 stop:4226 length:447 start_codon:yes stop_codon:yes gene_type:complete